MKLILLGSGPSLRGFDLGTLRGRSIWAINDADRWSDARSTTFSADRIWIERHKEYLQHNQGYLDIEGLYEGGPIILAWDGEPPSGYPYALWISRHRGNGLAADGVNASTSGFAALNWAVRCGAKRILLLGYDYRSDGPHRHWYDEEEPPPEPGRAVDLWPQWVGAFDEALPELQALGVQVMNGSPESAITAFPKCTPEEGLKWFDESALGSRRSS